MRDTVFIQTYGCQMNEHDSARMLEILKRNGFEPARSAEDATVILLNTCSVRENPENKVYSQLGRLRPLKQANPGLIIGVGGCVAQQAGQELLNREASVDLVFGPDNYVRLPELLEAVRQGERVLATEWLERPPTKVLNFIPPEWIDAGHVEGCSAYVAIMKGCDNFCTFCIVPYTRGREASREPADILREIGHLTGKGAREIWLLGQNVNAYRAGACGFRELLDAVSRAPGLKRVRFTSPHPKDWTHALSDLMAERDTICNYLHLPFQAGSNRVLELMSRRYTIEGFLDQVQYAQRVNPRIEISTDLIVGFPTETDADFERTLEVLETVRFSQIFSFKYSPRPGTRAAGMDDDVPRAVKDERLQRVIALQERITAEQSERYVGTAQDVLIDGPDARRAGAMNGRTDGHRPVSVTGPGLAVGELVPVRITGWRNHWLEGERLDGDASGT
ncbi:MAG: tRNA (N6-isopentenyl adenosine(37)-C2)-methylthiotransferase MiaB [Candidatus Hydrogenedentes bacterium]|nr:tRNA (N6-isopentenyl adenosine(37)-C2)-methylthiotransferase MiaB [Candidatus Hydrogenedentota bacterium]